MLQLLEKKKELSSKIASLEEGARIAAGIKEEAHRLEQRCQQVQASNTALKKQLKALQQGHNQAKALTEQVKHAMILLVPAGTTCVDMCNAVHMPEQLAKTALQPVNHSSDVSSIICQNVLCHRYIQVGTTDVITVMTKCSS